MQSRLDTVPRRSPGWQVVYLVQRHGEMTVRELVNALGVTTTAVRLQVDRLVGEGILAVARRCGRRGRPSDVFTLTERGRGLIEPRYDILLRNLLEELTSELGADRVTRVLGRVAARMAEEFGRRISGVTVRQRLDSLVELLQEQGIAAALRQEGNLTIFRQCGCPYFKLARGNRTFCLMDARMMMELIGHPVRQTQCQQDGYSACEFEINVNGDLNGSETDMESSEPRPDLAGIRKGRVG